jgi:hypothetical protein
VVVIARSVPRPDQTTPHRKANDTLVIGGWGWLFLAGDQNGVDMHRRGRDRDGWGANEAAEWPDSSVELDGRPIDDDAFARAIAEGRRHEVAA